MANYKFLKYPKTVVSLAKELIRITDDYNNRQIDNDEFKNIIIWYKDNYPEKLFANNNYNPSIKRIIGKHRIIQINKIISLSTEVYKK